MVYSFQRPTDEELIEEEVEAYLSPGPFGRKMVLSGTDRPRTEHPDTRFFSCLTLCFIGPMIVFGIIWVILVMIGLLS